MPLNKINQNQFLWLTYSIFSTGNKILLLRRCQFIVKTCSSRSFPNSCSVKIWRCPWNVIKWNLTASFFWLQLEPHNIKLSFDFPKSSWPFRNPISEEDDMVFFFFLVRRELLWLESSSIENKSISQSLLTSWRAPNLVFSYPYITFPYQV